MVTKLWPLCKVKLLKNNGDKTVVTEKAGVGGSTPSLATIIVKNLAESRLGLSVRYFSARSGLPGYDDGEGLKLELHHAHDFGTLLRNTATGH